MLDILMAHSAARRDGKPPFFFSRFNFERMKERGNTHFCFACLSNGGYQLDNEGNPTNVDKDEGWAMKLHAADHAPYVIGDADKYNNVWDWLEAKIPPEFPYIVTVPQIP